MSNNLVLNGKKILYSWFLAILIWPHFIIRFGVDKNWGIAMFYICCLAVSAGIISLSIPSNRKRCYLPLSLILSSLFVYMSGFLFMSAMRVSF